MYERLKDLPVFRTPTPPRRRAAAWNAWRRYREPDASRGCSFGRKGLPPLSLLLGEREWVLTEYAYDFPVLSWSDFQDQGRGLHEPVPCTVRHYHQGASRFRDKALVLMVEGELELRMKKAQKVSEPIYPGLEADQRGGLTDAGRVIMDAQAFGLLPATETSAACPLARLQNLARTGQQGLEAPTFGGLPSRLPQDLRERHERIYAAAVERARAVGWDDELVDDE